MKRTLWQIMVPLMVGPVLLLSGCAGMEHWLGSAWPANGGGASSGRVLSDSRRIAALPAAEQDDRVRRLQADFAQAGGDRERFVLACLALQPNSRHRDAKKALRLLQDYRLGSAPREDLLALAELLEGLLLQQQDLRQRLTAERERSESLASKLKALEDIEQIIQERERKALPSP